MSDLYEARDTANRMRLAATVLLESLTAEQRARAMLPFDDDAERRDWDFVPKQGRNGLPLRDMTFRQQTLTHQLIAVGVSLPAYAKVLSIMAMEHLLRELQKGRMSLGASDFRSPGNYFLSVFGRPNHEETWGWRLLGHHVSLNFTLVDGFFIAPTPFLLGNEPAEFGIIKPLREEEDLGFDLLASLDAEQARRAIIHDVAPPDFVTRVVPRLGEEERPEEYELGFDHYRISEHDREKLKYVRSAPRGLPGAEMTGAQLDGLTALVECYVRRMPDDVAAQELERLRQAGIERIFFAWAGQPERGQPHYYRLQGPDFLVEFDNTQASGNHIHTVVRSPSNDFGDDLLGRHYREHHLPVRLGRVTSSAPLSVSRPADGH
jgi:hypothetical protein